jgi:glyoxylase-like metal-dependent hydrolase (beta-lactamase superfamily II)
MRTRSRVTQRVIMPLAWLLLSGSLTYVAAQSPPLTITQSYTKARRLLDSAVAAHGGIVAIRDARRIGVTMEGQDYWRLQSRRVNPPYDSEPFTGDLVLDAAHNRLAWTTTSHYPGGFHNSGRVVIDGARAFYVNYRQRVYVMTPGRTIDAQQDVITRLPHLLLLAALDNAASLRWLGPIRLSTGTTVEAIAASTPGGALTLGFDPDSKRLRATLEVRNDPVAGDASHETEFLGYTRVGRVLIPIRRVTRTAGETTQDVRYAATTLDPAISDSLLSPPAGLPEFPMVAAPDTVRELAPHTWVIRSAGYWSLVVEFAEYVLVMEAPRDGVPAVIAKIAQLAPGKPIRYVAITHHHDDHAGGLRHYVAAGATVVTTPGNRELFEHMAAAHSTIESDTVAGPVRIETITNRERTFTDGSQTVELHDIGPSPHADEMLVAWLPRDGILFQGDQLNLPPNGAILPGGSRETMSYFADWVRQRGWPVRILAGVHMVPGTMAQLRDALAAATPP